MIDLTPVAMFSSCTFAFGTAAPVASPDHPAQWSKTDLEEAHWIGCSYVITRVAQGKADVTNSFELTGSDEADKAFRDEKVEVG